MPQKIKHGFRALIDEAEREKMRFTLSDLVTYFDLWIATRDDVSQPFGPPKLKAGGALTAHNVSRGGWGMTGDFYSYVTSLPALQSSFRAGVFVAFKK